MEGHILEGYVATLLRLFLAKTGQDVWLRNYITMTVIIGGYLLYMHVIYIYIYIHGVNNMIILVPQKVAIRHNKMK